MLVSTIDRRVDAETPIDLARSIRVRENFRVDAAPRAVTAQPAVPFPRRLPRTELRRQITSWRTRPEPPHDRLDHATMIRKRATALRLRGRHQRLDTSPLSIRESLNATRSRPTLKHPTRLGDSP